MYCTLLLQPASFNWKTTALVGTMRTWKLHWGCKFIGIKRRDKLRNYYDKVKDFETFLEMYVSCSAYCVDRNIAFCWVTLKFSINLSWANITKSEPYPSIFWHKQLKLVMTHLFQEIQSYMTKTLFQKEIRQIFCWLLLAVKDKP